MKSAWLSKSTPEWPDEINGHITRPRYGECPTCGAPEKTWCSTDCSRLDPMDYR